MTNQEITENAKNGASFIKKYSGEGVGFTRSDYFTYTIYADTKENLLAFMNTMTCSFEFEWEAFNELSGTILLPQQGEK